MYMKLSFLIFRSCSNQKIIKRSISESGCPPHIIDDLMENCHERRWPPGLSSLETRQNNRRYTCALFSFQQYENFISIRNYVHQ